MKKKKKNGSCEREKENSFFGDRRREGERDPPEEIYLSLGAGRRLKRMGAKGVGLLLFIRLVTGEILRYTC